MARLINSKVNRAVWSKNIHLGSVPIVQSKDDDWTRSVIVQPLIAISPPDVPLHSGRQVQDPHLVFIDEKDAVAGSSPYFRRHVSKYLKRIMVTPDTATHSESTAGLHDKCFDDADPKTHLGKSARSPRRSLAHL
jgi:hypothetical protein